MDITALLEAGATNPVTLFAMAIVIGALHGLEPGHSKTMIASYIIAINGSVSKAFMLGVSAAVSHSIVVWVLAAIALTYGNEMIGEELEPWFMIVSGILVVGMAIWMVRMSWPKKAVPTHDHYGLEHGDQGHHHHHHHNHSEDAHARAHAAEIRERLAGNKVGNWQTIVFGLTGGLIPCPAATTVFILCMQLGKAALGVALVGAFSLGLAAVLVAVGVVAALGMSALSSKSSCLNQIFAAAPYISGVLIGCIGLLIIWNGYNHLH